MTLILSWGLSFTFSLLNQKEVAWRSYTKLWLSSVFLDIDYVILSCATQKKMGSGCNSSNLNIHLKLAKILKCLSAREPVNQMSRSVKGWLWMKLVQFGNSNRLRPRPQPIKQPVELDTQLVKFWVPTVKPNSQPNGRLVEAKFCLPAVLSLPPIYMS